LHGGGGQGRQWAEQEEKGLTRLERSQGPRRSGRGGCRGLGCGGVAGCGWGRFNVDFFNWRKLTDRCGQLRLKALTDCLAEAAEHELDALVSVELGASDATLPFHSPSFEAEWKVGGGEVVQLSSRPLYLRRPVGHKSDAV
jgi:hypothetical protein